MRVRTAFTMIELIFVIVVMGIIGKFGVEFIAEAYKGFINAKINHELQATSEQTVEIIAARLEHRIKDSVVARTGETTVFTALSDTSGDSFHVLEWVSTDIDGFRGTTTPLWSGILDLNHTRASSTVLVSPQTDTSEINTLIDTLSDENSDINKSALYFIGSNNDINGYGWNGTAILDQFAVMHPINSAVNSDEFAPKDGNFTGIDVYEYYKLAWTANAIVMKDYNTSKYAGLNMGDLVFYYDYQPWNGEKFYDTGKDIKKVVLMENVSSFRFIGIGSIMKIQVCTKSTLIEGDEYSLCKEKTVF